MLIFLSENILNIIFFIGIILILILIIFRSKKKLISNNEVNIVINKDKIIKSMPGNTLLNILSLNNIFISSTCGGNGACGMCKCVVISGGDKISNIEKDHISKKEEINNMRLACQVRVERNINIKILNDSKVISVKKYIGSVVSNKNVAIFIKNLIIKLNNNNKLKFRPGEYVKIKAKKGLYYFRNFNISKKYKLFWSKLDLDNCFVNIKEEVFRAYSIANHPVDSSIITFLVRIAVSPHSQKKLSHGLCSSYIFNLKKGENIEFSGPYGDFFIKNTNNEMVYIGGGAGMGPIRSHIFHLFYTLKTTRKITFFYGARSFKDIFFQEDFLNIERKYSNFKYYIALSELKSTDKWNGLSGYIHNVVYNVYLKEHKFIDSIEYYLCGPPLMIGSTELMLSKIGVKKEMISFDKF